MNTEIIIELIETGKVYFRDLDNNIYNFKEINGFGAYCSSFYKEVKFVSCSYDSLTIPKNSIIYCDPPYQNTTGYKINFDHTKFWQWVREKYKEGHTIFILEYNAPEDFEVLYEIDLLNPVCKKQGKYEVAKEKLFAPKGQKRVDTIFDIMS